MGGIKAFWKRATTLPKSIRKINIGHAVKDAATGALKSLSDEVKRAGGTIGKAISQVPDTVNETRDAAKTVKMLPWLIGGVAVIALYLYSRKKG